MRFGAVSLIAMTTALCLVGGASGQTAGGSADGGDSFVLEEIIVTARKRAEDMLKTPVAVSVLTSEAIEQRGIVSVADIGTFSPGVNVSNNQAGRNDRSFQQIIIRGFSPSAPDVATVATFIDGVPVASATAVNNISDPARIEVLKGPQSAYFGRNTFAGAVNVVNKEPGDEFGGNVTGMIGTRDNYRIRADVEGPILGDKLTFRASGNRFSKDGSYKNGFNNSETLGDQETTSGTLLLVAKPIEGLTIKAFGLLSEDEDGPSAQGFIPAYTVTNANGQVVLQSQSNCTLTGSTSAVQGAGQVRMNPFFCGTAPKLIPGQSPSMTSINDSYIKNFLAQSRNRFISPSDGVQGYGLVRRYTHGHITADYEIPDTDFTVSYLGGTNHERYSALVDLDNYGDISIANNGFGSVPAGARSYFDYPFLVERKSKDYSHELRLGYDGGGALRFITGANYMNAETISGNGGGNGALGTTVFFNANGKTRSRTISAFYGITYQVLDDLSFSAEGRYQVDKLYAYAQPTGYTATTSVFLPAGFYPGGSLLLSEDFKNFMPRFIAQYDLNDDVMVYASYAKGVNPARFNTSFLTATAAAQRAAAAGGLQIGIEPEKVTNYEIGMKGRLFNGRMQFALDGYFAQWRNQINQSSFPLVDPDTNAAQIVTGYINSGSVDIKGLELDGNYQLLGNVRMNFAGAITDTKIKDYRAAQVSQLTGIFDFSGKEMPNTSKYSASAGLQYSGDFGESFDGAWFARADYSFKSGVWSNAANVVKTPDLHMVNVRMGASQGPVSIDLFVNNLFDTQRYTSINDQFVFTNNFAYTTYLSALVVGLPERRTMGLQMKYSF
ncbi:TonB-dependent receptor [Niveispirillum irakense]|uniref:TonB-dependent receptor n=1 Tax=Niveispirillum irakense TaxID=34011 RepID=UPI00041B3487|nr:TonB-dependent receptor [Niveispirillum irakense]